jgi:hypothetical protein
VSDAVALRSSLMQSSEQTATLSVPVSDEFDTSGAEYLARDDREKASGYNHLPHRPAPPAIKAQRRRVRQGARHQVAADAG